MEDLKKLKRTFNSIEKDILTKDEVLETIFKFEVKNTPKKIESSGVVIDTKRKRVIFRDRVIELQPQEYLLLLFFIKNKNVVLTRDEILEEVWANKYVGDRIIDAYRCHLNRKLGATFIETKRGFGYEWIDED